MYNGIGLQTPRGSGTNGYIQTNKFFIKSKPGMVAPATRGYEGDQGTGGITKKPNKEILEHDRKRQIHLRLVELEDKLIEQGYTDAEIAEKLDEARKTLEAAAASEDAGGPTAVLVSEARASDTQSHQIAARKEKQLEIFRAALGIRSSEQNEQGTEAGDEELTNNRRSESNEVGKWSEKPEHAFLDRDYSRKKPEGDVKLGKDDKRKSNKASESKKKGEELDMPRRSKKEESKKRRRHADHSDTDSDDKLARIPKKNQKNVKGSDTETDTDSDYGKKKKEQKKSRRSRRERVTDSDSDSSDSDQTDSDSDAESGEIKARSVKRHKKSRRHDSDSEDSAGGGKRDRALHKHRSRRNSANANNHSATDESDDSATDSDDDGKLKLKHEAQRYKTSRRRHGSDTGEDDVGKLNLEHDAHNHKKPQRHHSDSGTRLDSSSHRAEETRLHKKISRRHDSEDETDTDGEDKRKISSPRKPTNLKSARGGLSNNASMEGGRRMHEEMTRSHDVRGEIFEERTHRRDLRGNKHDIGSDDSDHESDKKFQKDRSGRRHDTDDEDSTRYAGASVKKSLGKPSVDRERDPSSDDSDGSDSSKSSASSSGSDYSRERTVKKKPMDSNNRGAAEGRNDRKGRGGHVSNIEKGPKSIVDVDDDRKRERSGLANYSNQSGRDAVHRSNYDSQERMSDARKLDGMGKTQEQGRNKIVDNDADHKDRRVDDAYQDSRRYQDKADREKDNDYSRSLKSSRYGNETEHEGKSRYKDELHNDSRNNRADKVDKGRERDIQQSRDGEEERKRRRHQRDDEEDDRDQLGGSRSRGRGKEEERGNGGHEGDRHTEYTKRARYDDYRRSEKKYYEDDRHRDRVRYRD
ncbi:hypothetical protein Tsubulata_046523 [Turnera subulata]|uniref:CWF21 domain-containing protein n=1 Tax=Turnera subulata TaxID=218843 RepID=A0A9Q0GCP0_9ROSI|nr:hypothetical protein Tsubulata_046523 [Turnera subulata]